MSGRVQGVWFRESTREKAVSLSVAGWVRNLADGRVEAELEGAAAAVEQVIAWCTEGPVRARVTAVEVEERTPLGDVTFRVR